MQSDGVDCIVAEARLTAYPTVMPLGKLQKVKPSKQVLSLSG